MNSLPAKQSTQCTALQLRFINHLLANPKDKAGAMKAAGCKAKEPGQRACQELSKPHVRAELMRQSQETFSLEGVVLAQHKVVHLIKESRSERVQLEAAQDVLDRHAETAKHVSGSANVNINLDFSAPRVEHRVIDGTHEIVDQDTDGGLETPKSE